MAKRTRRIPTAESVKPKKRNSFRGRRRKEAPAKEKSGKLVHLKREGYVTDKIKGHNPINTIRNEHKYLHVSDLLNSCMRSFALADKYNVKLTGDVIYDNLGVVFAIGRVIGDYLVDKSSKIIPQYTYGIWTCKCRHSKYTGTYANARKEDRCSKCDTGLNEYNEFVVANDDVMVSGSVDLTLLINNAFYLTEIKSIKKEDWEVLARPLPLHILQIVFYWWLFREAGYSLYDQISVIYVNKSYTRGSPIKEFTFNPKDHLHRLDDYLEDARDLKKAKAGEGELPVRICANANATVAKKCQLCTICFTEGLI